MSLTVAVPALAPGVLPDPRILAGQLAPASLAGYRRDIALYLRFCGDLQPALEATSLARWRTHLAQQTSLSPHTINRRLAAVKRLLQEAAAQGYVAVATAEAFHRVAGVQVTALRHRLKATARTRLTPGQMRQLCDAPDRTTVLGWRDRALLHTLATSGCRVSEVVTLTAAQLLSRDGSFFLEVLGKNQIEHRTTPLSHEAYASIQAWLARRRRGRRVSARAPRYPPCAPAGAGCCAGRQRAARRAGSAAATTGSATGAASLLPAPARFSGQAAANSPAVRRALSRPRERRAKRGEP